MRLKSKFRFCNIFWVLTKTHFPPLPICKTTLTGSALLPNPIINQKKCGTDGNWLKPILKHRATEPKELPKLIILI